MVPRSPTLPTHKVDPPFLGFTPVLSWLCRARPGAADQWSPRQDPASLPSQDVSSQGSWLLALSRKLCGPKTNRCPGSIPEAHCLTNGETEAQEGNRAVRWGMTGEVPRWAGLPSVIPGEPESQKSVQQRLRLCAQARHCPG